jgi:hypothetical protein
MTPPPCSGNTIPKALDAAYRHKPRGHNITSTAIRYEPFERHITRIDARRVKSLAASAAALQSYSILCIRCKVAASHASTYVLSPKLTILTTGSNQGLGYETARQLYKHLHINLFLSRRNPERVQQALESMSKEYWYKVILDRVIIDVSDNDCIKDAVKGVVTVEGVLVVGYVLSVVVLRS